MNAIEPGPLGHWQRWQNLRVGPCYGWWLVLCTLWICSNRTGPGFCSNLIGHAAIGDCSTRTVMGCFCQQRIMCRKWCRAKSVRWEGHPWFWWNVPQKDLMDVGLPFEMEHALGKVSIHQGQSWHRYVWVVDGRINVEDYVKECLLPSALCWIGVGLYTFGSRLGRWWLIHCFTLLWKHRNHHHHFASCKSCLKFNDERVDLTKPISQKWMGINNGMTCKLFSKGYKVLWSYIFDTLVSQDMQLVCIECLPNRW